MVKRFHGFLSTGQPNKFFCDNCGHHGFAEPSYLVPDDDGAESLCGRCFEAVYPRLAMRWAFSREEN